jgi:ABC-type transporter Mla subunit MlaD
LGEGTDSAGGAPEEGAPPKRTGGNRLGSIEDEAERADARLRQLERSSGDLRESVDALAEATGELRRQSAQMREAALRVAEAATLARKRRSRDRSDGQAADRPPRTK